MMSTAPMKTTIRRTKKTPLKIEGLLILYLEINSLNFSQWGLNIHFLKRHNKN